MGVIVKLTTWTGETVDSGAVVNVVATSTSVVTTSLADSQKVVTSKQTSPSTRAGKRVVQAKRASTRTPLSTGRDVMATGDEAILGLARDRAGMGFTRPVALNAREPWS